MKKHNTDYFDWQEDVEPVIVANLNELLVAKGVEPVRDLHGGSFKDGKWVGVGESDDYRNYWHAYIELWGEGLSNDNFQQEWFPDPSDDEGWQYLTDRLRKWAVAYYKPTDPNWTDDLVIAMRKLVKEHFPLDEDGDSCRIVFWWCW